MDKDEGKAAHAAAEPAPSLAGGAADAGGFRPYDPSRGARAASLNDLKAFPKEATSAGEGFKSGSPSGVSANPTITALPMSPPPPAPLPGAGAEASAPTMTSGPTAGSGAANSWMAARQQAADAAAAVAAAGGNINGQMLDTQQRLESVGQRLSMPGGQRLESLAGNLSSMMASSNGLDQMRALGSINSAGNSAGSGGGGMVPAAMQLAQRGGLGGGGYPAMLQQQYLQQTLPWLLRVQGAQQAMFPDGAGAASAAAVLNQAAGDGGSAAAAVALAGGKPHDGGPGFPATKKRKGASAGGRGASLGGEVPLSGEGVSVSARFSGSQSDEDDEQTRAGGDDGDEEEGDDKVKRRLAQNREAARKSRQRRKAYVQSLEEEVRSLRATKQAAPAQSLAPSGSLTNAGFSGGSGGNAYGLAATGATDPSALFSAMLTRLPQHAAGQAMQGGGRVPSVGSSGQAAGSALSQQNQEVLQAFDKWRGEHVATVLQVRAALDEGAGDAALRPLIEEARGQLWTLFAMKKAVVCSESVLLIIYLEHLLPPERLYAWLGGLRASDACGGLLVKLEGQGLAPQQRTKLEALRESLAQQENSLGRGYSEVLGELAARAAQVPLQLPGAAGGGAAKQLRTWDSPDVLGKLDALRMTLLRGDGVWEQYLEETERVLTLRQYGAAVTALMETSLQLQGLHLPWLALLRRPPGGAEAQ